jgi:hypothetical protein
MCHLFLVAKYYCGKNWKPADECSYLSSSRQIRRRQHLIHLGLEQHYFLLTSFFSTCQDGQEGLISRGKITV